ncbi:aminopeptidase P N-terminal domain-containing protein [Suttonella sp. R2A3]|uniref:aminopeptidase P N-terminal domain-containing protein n=1 Tax=Suttonella sp. R2A3 TaxID=2908648 RepID=UPI001F20D814|nr:aminopeptidase P N-terminal domain-containing protein [Suttonella sp. R2A3]UJF25347.1 aminopeptidase P N-terminal domain-containing protein [Suttonella sp. R2A3]
MMHEVLAQSVFAARRTQLFEQLPEGAAVALYAAEPALRNNDVYYPYRQDSYFWYLTGFPEGSAIAVLTRKNSKVHYTLFSAPRNPDKEIWEGKIIGQQGAIDRYGADEAYSIDEADKISDMLADCSRIYTVLGVHEKHDQRITALLRDIHQKTGRGGAPIDAVADLRRIVDEQRMIKSAEEQKLLHRAGQISAAGHRAAMLASRPGAYEYEVQAALEGEFRRQACHWSFNTIVAGGANACCLHYTTNQAPLNDGELLMVDAGAEYAGYAGDISRTHPINGRFTRDQQALYEIVLAAQTAAIDAARPGIRHLELHTQTRRYLMQGMIDEGIISGSLDYWLEENRFMQFFMHGTGHWLGLDVHDVGVYKPEGQSREYRPGMVVTIEPGLYIQPDDTSVDVRWRGIGIRIEDDVIITNSAPDVTTADVPKTVAEIEALLKTCDKRCS